MKATRTLLLALAALVLSGCCGWFWWGCDDDCYYDDCYYKADAWEPEQDGSELGLLPADDAAP